MGSWLAFSKLSGEGHEIEAVSTPHNAANLGLCSQMYICHKLLRSKAIHLCTFCCVLYKLTENGKRCNYICCQVLQLKRFTVWLWLWCQVKYIFFVLRTIVSYCTHLNTDPLLILFATTYLHWSECSLFQHFVYLFSPTQLLYPFSSRLLFIASSVSHFFFKCLLSQTVTTRSKMFKMSSFYNSRVNFCTC